MCWYFAYVLLLHSILGDMSKSPNTEIVCGGFEEDVDPETLLSGYILSEFNWDGTDYFKWTGSDWNRCDESDVVCVDFVEFTGCDTPIKTFDLTAPCILKGAEAMRAYISKLTEATQSFDGSEAHTALLERLRNSSIAFNTKPELIPCHSVVVDIADCTTIRYKKSHMFSTRLSFDPVKTESLLVEKYFDRLHCDKSDLATHLVRWGCGLKPSLTIISGPTLSGKSTLLKVGQTMYSPYACSSEQHATGSVNYKLVRTCFCDDSSLLSDEEAVRSHPCDHLVVTVTGETDTEMKKFGGRKVKHLVLSESVEPSMVKDSIATNLCTRKQLSHVLGWALKKYNTKVSIVHLLLIASSKIF